jgi:hypothetical protein
MTRIIAAIVGALKREWTQDGVYFHAHAGRPYPCYDRDCRRPRRGAG